MKSDSDIMDQIKDKIVEVQTIEVGKDEILVIKLKHPYLDATDMARVQESFQHNLPNSKIMVCDDLFNFIKITKKEADLIDLLKG